MTKDNIHEYWPLLEALKQGETIQVRGICAGVWTDLDNPAFTDLPENYRIKPCGVQE